MKNIWTHIEPLYAYRHIAGGTIQLFKELKTSQSSYTKKEGNGRHLCSFFLPYDAAKGMIYLGHHKKADDWIPPGGHMEPGEMPYDTAIREMKEELDYTITRDMVEPWNLSVKPINQPARGCMAHYDIWHIVHMPKTEFIYDKREYYGASWFPVDKGVSKITKNPDFADIVRQLSR